MSVVAILLPVLVLGFLAGLVGLGWWAVRRRRARRRARRARADPRR
jgi:Flp pilus assembly protein TadB